MNYMALQLQPVLWEPNRKYVATSETEQYSLALQSSPLTFGTPMDRLYSQFDLFPV